MDYKHTFSVDFVVRSSKGKKSKGKAIIYARITVDGEEPKEISVKEQIKITDWNSNTHRVKGNGIESARINQSIQDVEFKIKEKYRALQRQDEIITAQSIKDAYNGVQKNLKGHKLRELLTFYLEIWRNKLAPDNIKNYNTTVEYTLRYLNSKGEGTDLYLSQIDGEFATKLENYIRNNPIKAYDPCKGNGVGKHMQRFRRIFNWASDDLKWIEQSKIKTYSCPIRKNKRSKLPFEEVIKVETKHFSDPTLSYIKDIFIYSCYTGLAFADIMGLTEADFNFETDGTVWCKIYRKKSIELCAVPLLEEAAKILLVYRQEAKKEGRKAIFRKIANATVNSELKIIQAACEVATYLTFHVARHTFAKTIALLNGIPLETVQMMMGHTKISTTQIYADVDEEKIQNDMTGLNEKLDRKRKILFERIGNSLPHEAEG